MLYRSTWSLTLTEAQPMAKYTYQQLVDAGYKTKVFFEVFGCSRRGNVTKREGKTVLCGHEHRTQQGAYRCCILLLKSRPGGCQHYKVREVHAFKIPKGK